MRNGEGKARNLRSQLWFDDPHDPGMTALYLERYLNYGLTRKELQSGRPIIGIAQTGNDLAPCNRHHLDLAYRVKEGVREAGGVPFVSRSPQFRRRASARPPPLTATWPTLGLWRCCTATRSTRHRGKS